eukprot:392422_1
MDAKVAVCWTLQSIHFSYSNVFCKVIEISLWDDENTISAEINIITTETMINDNNTLYHEHGHSRISQKSILRFEGDEVDDSFFLVWSNKRRIGYDVYTKVLSLKSNNDTNI